MTLLVAWVYCGGVFAFPREKIGLINRLLWPGLLGMALHAWARRASPTDLDGNPTAAVKGGE